MGAFNIITVGLAVASAAAYLVVHFVRATRRKSAAAGCPGCALAASATAHHTGSGRSRGTGCPGCG
jgi:hypothetical protein